MKFPFLKEKKIYLILPIVWLLMVTYLNFSDSNKNETFISKSHMNIEQFTIAIELYKNDIGLYPESLADLIINNDEINWNGPYINVTKLEFDQWNRGLKYKVYENGERYAIESEKLLKLKEQKEAKYFYGIMIIISIFFIVLINLYYDYIKDKCGKSKRILLLITFIISSFVIIYDKLPNDYLGISNNIFLFYLQAGILIIIAFMSLIMLFKEKHILNMISFSLSIFTLIIIFRSIFSC